MKSEQDNVTVTPGVIARRQEFLERLEADIRDDLYARTPSRPATRRAPGR